MISHHPGEELLVSYAAGTSSEAVSLIIVAHLALCPECRSAVSCAECLGGILLDALEPMRLPDSAIMDALACLESDPSQDSPPSQPARNIQTPDPLHSWLGGDFGDVRWRPVAPGLKYRRVGSTANGFRVGLIRSKPGYGIAVHSHAREEYSLVLSGGYSDQTGHYARGDFQTATPDLLHNLVADQGEDCIVLVVAEAPLLFRNPVLGVLARLIGF